MKASRLTEYLQFAIKNRFPVLIKGKPGIGKSDIVEQAAKLANAELIIDHPVVADPTDFKGLPFAQNNVHNGVEANFLPFKNLRMAIEAKVPTVFFLDDLGQAPASVQAAVMQLLLARRVGEHKVSDLVTFVAATNRKEDKAAVMGLLEPVKSRFSGGIIELEVDTNDWVKWALTDGDMPFELISFIRFNPRMLDKFEPTKDIINSASPRTVASVGRVQKAGLPQELEAEVFEAIAGQAFAVEYRAFLKMVRDLPNIDEIIMNPTGAPIPKSPGGLYAVSGALAMKSNKVNIEPIITYLERLAPEYAVATLKDAGTRNREVFETKAYINWTIKNQNIM
jgi:hypothetical protein